MKGRLFKKYKQFYISMFDGIQCKQFNVNVFCEWQGTVVLVYITLQAISEEGTLL